jgi:serine/threonine protein kinase
MEFTPAYAAPETVRAFLDGQDTLVADGAMDVWALGVIAFEILTEERAFPVGMSQEQIFEALVGITPLPWEGADRDPAAAARLAKLQMFKHDILQCLERDPHARPRISAVVLSWRHVFMAATTKAPVH